MARLTTAGRRALRLACEEWSHAHGVLAVLADARRACKYTAPELTALEIIVSGIKDNWKGVVLAMSSYSYDFCGEVERSLDWETFDIHVNELITRYFGKETKK